MQFFLEQRAAMTPRYGYDHSTPRSPSAVGGSPTSVALPDCYGHLGAKDIRGTVLFLEGQLNFHQREAARCGRCRPHATHILRELLGYKRAYMGFTGCWLPQQCSKSEAGDANALPAIAEVDEAPYEEEDARDKARAIVFKRIVADSACVYAVRRRRDERDLVSAFGRWRQTVSQQRSEEVRSLKRQVQALRGEASSLKRQIRALKAGTPSRVAATAVKSVFGRHPVVKCLAPGPDHAVLRTYVIPGTRVSRILLPGQVPNEPRCMKH